MRLKLTFVYLSCFLCLATFCIATTTVTGHVSTLGTTAVTSSTFVRFWLRGCGGNQPRINGTSIIAPSQGGTYFMDFPVNASGNVSGTLYSTRDGAGTGNGDIECGGSQTSVWYGMVIFNGGKAGPETPVHAKSGGSLDVSNVTPITTSPVVNSPSGDSTYARIDGGNTPFSGPVSFGSTINATHGGSIGGTFTGNPALTGSPTASSLNSVLSVDGVKYPYTATGINQCLTDAASKSGVCDASGVPATTFTSQITVSSGETLVVPSTGGSAWTWSGISNGTSCGIDVEDGGSLIGNGNSNGGSKFTLLTSGTVSMRGLLCGNISGTSSYVRIEPGLIALPQTGASFTKGVVDIEGWFDASVLRNVSISLTQDTTANQTGLYASNLCCSATIERVVSDGGFQSGAIPAHITYNSGEVATDAAILIANSFDHPGSGKNAIVFDGTLMGPVLDVGQYVEGSNTDTTTAAISVTSVKGAVTFVGGKVNMLAVASTAYCLDAPNTSGNSIATYGLACLSQAGGAQNAINDHITGYTVSSGAQGVVPDYNTTDFVSPTIASGFGTSPSIVTARGAKSFEVNVGTGGSATSGVLTMPTTPAAKTGWSCQAIDMNTNIVTRETAFTTTSVTLTAASAWTASDKLLINCGAF